MSGQPHDETAENPSQHPVTREVDKAVFGKTPQSGTIRMVVLAVVILAGLALFFYTQAG
jgi:hypothetical protein